MHNDKAVLRKKLLSLRKTAVSVELEIGQIRQFEEFNKAKTIFCYISAHGEVGTYSLIEELLKEKKVVVPYCTDTVGNMICSEIKSLSELKDGKFGIPEPVNPVEFPKEEIDFVIVPGVAFDKEGFRLGYGKGYYDRFLSDITPYRLGVCKEEFYLERLPHGEYDVRMDGVLVIDKEVAQ